MVSHNLPPTASSAYTRQWRNTAYETLTVSMGNPLHYAAAVVVVVVSVVVVAAVAVVIMNFIEKTNQ